MRLGLFGGTFDPIHNGHLAVARAARERYQLDAVWLIPNRLPPHKEAATGANYEERLRMVELACAGEAGLRASDIENQEGKSYTIQTLRRLRIQLGEDCEFFFIIGADAFAEVGLWFEVEEVFRMTEFIVVSRPGFDYPVPEGARVHRLDGLELPVSSTEVRAQLRRGERAVELPIAVQRYIEGNGLYRRARSA